MLAAMGTAQEKATAAKPVPLKPLTLSAKVSGDGKSLITDLDSEWIVSNPSSLDRYKAQLVSVHCYVDAVRGRIEILSVKAAQKDPQLRIAAQRQDSAFRR